MKSRQAPPSPPRGLRVTQRADPEGVLVVLSWPAAPHARDEGDRLSEAEREVVSLLRAGAPYAEIARARGTALGTVKKQIASIYRKLRVGSRAELVARWAR